MVSGCPSHRLLGSLTNHVVAKAHGAEGDEGEVEAFHVAPALHVGEEQRGQQQEEQEAREQGAGARQPAGLGRVLWEHGRSAPMWPLPSAGAGSRQPGGTELEAVRRGLPAGPHLLACILWVPRARPAARSRGTSPTDPPSGQ